ncbi:MAG: CCA tRNA nucleotidyltransferase [Nitrosopumilus sp.]|uniref:CCA tRNA nucleotidyltransferase n=1 Tax=Nitrosopumilus sp. TaxID=2024843 RepID=UPI00247C1D49|nr:CCA tRNA nucleotidyltransferase [Nitrosopumilus sp.]MCV0393324.1 CCA tRNA nucleotidyltransferase [Nitrosopumilus sp.]
MKKIISKIEKLVVPSTSLEKAKQETAELAFNLVKNEIKKFSEVIGIEFGGSYAKGTWLKQDADVDIFVRFKKSVSDDRFEKISRKIGFESLKKYSPYVRYSEHPYVEAKIKNTKINVVPFFDVKSGQWKSSADRSPFHTKFMKKSLTDKMKNEVRILKTFLKANEIYGAEIAKQGFSGYVSEVLILHYGSFENVIKSISKIKENQNIGNAKKKFDTSIVIMDPIDNNRNLAAAISDENIGKFILTARAFKEKAKLEFFKKRSIRISKKHWENLLVVKFNFKKRSPDIIWGQIKRASTSLSTQLELGGFRVLRSNSFTDQENDAYLFFFLESMKISPTYIKNGPEFFREEDSKSFVSKNIKNSELMWIGKNKKIISLEKRTFPDASKFLTNFLKNNLKTGIPNGIQSDLERGFVISVGSKNLSKSIKEAANKLISTDATILYFN